ncbi:MAG: M20 family peptidase, partial [Acidimicrobiia bacterium]|nr:M20 family peptidase [Acidimicrobiia bacterium]
MPDTGGARARPEQEALTFLKATADDQLAFARRLIATPSPTPPGDERAVAR